MNEIKLISMLLQERKGVGAMELEWIVLLRFDIHADYLKACPVVAYCCSACAAKKIQEPHTSCLLFAVVTRCTTMGLP